MEQTINKPPFPGEQTDGPSVSDEFKPRQLLKMFRLFAVAFFFLLVYKAFSNPILNVACASIIFFAALIPTYLWCSGGGAGLPIYPLYAATHIWTYGLFLIGENSLLDRYYANDILYASVTVAAYLLIGTVVWRSTLKRKNMLSRPIRVLKPDTADSFFLISFALTSMFLLITSESSTILSAGMYSLLRGIAFGLTNLGVFILTYRWSKGQLSGRKSYLFWVLVILFITVNATSLMLVGGLQLLMLILLGYVLGRKKIPVIASIIVLCIVMVLHAGKGDMREQYWQGGSRSIPALSEYPGFFIEWFGAGADHLLGGQEIEQRQSFFNRAGLMSLLLLTQTESPDRVPYLEGASYAPILEQFVPRILSPTKISSHEGTVLLNMQYGLQTREDASSTSIGWGMLNEAYANFGFAGVVLLALLTGFLLGEAAKIGTNVPIYSSRYLFSLLVLSLSFSVEICTSALIAALYQYSVPLFLMTIFLTEKRSIKGAADIET